VISRKICASPHVEQVGKKIWVENSAGCSNSLDYLLIALLPRNDSGVFDLKQVSIHVHRLTLQEGLGGYSPKIWVGVCGALLQTLTLFQTKISDFPYPILDLTQNSIPYFRLAQELLKK